MEGAQHHEIEHRCRLRNLWKNKIMKYILRLKMQGDLKKLLNNKVLFILSSLSKFYLFYQVYQSFIYSFRNFWTESSI